MSASLPLQPISGTLLDEPRTPSVRLACEPVADKSHSLAYIVSDGTTACWGCFDRVKTGGRRVHNVTIEKR